MSAMHVLVLGASYGALVASKTALAGHLVTLVARPDEIRSLDANGLSVSLPLWPSEVRHDCIFRADRGTAKQIGRLGLLAPDQVNPTDFDLAFLAMQEPQVGAKELVTLFNGISDARLPLISLSNMPPLSFLERIPNFPIEKVAPHYHSPAAWKALHKSPQTLASPDAQAFRLDPKDPCALHVSLATNLKVAPFHEPEAQAKLSQLATDIENIRSGDGGKLPVKLICSEHLAIPFAKMPMLITGNYRCVQPGRITSIRDAVWGDIQESETIYQECLEVLRAFSVPEKVMVPFEQYAAAAKGLTKPSSAARVIDAGAIKVERSDAIMLTMAEHLGVPSARISQIVSQINNRITKNSQDHASQISIQSTN
jgi:hypothetical protein